MPSSNCPARGEDGAISIAVEVVEPVDTRLAGEEERPLPLLNDDDVDMGNGNECDRMGEERAEGMVDFE